MRVIAGQGFGLSSPVPTHSPLFYGHLEVSRSGAKVPLPDIEECAVYVAAGAVEAGAQRYETGKMLVLAKRSNVALRTLAPSTLMVLGGAAIGTRYIEWNFVSSSQERIDQAKADWRAGRMKLPDLDDQEFIPLPA